MASSTLVIPTIYHKPRKTKPEPPKVRSEDELLKFFLHGSYDVQRGNMHAAQIKEATKKIESSKDETPSIATSDTDDRKSKSRFMFEETYMINISVKQPDTTPLSKQIDVRIEKTPLDTQISDEKINDDDEVSSIFDEEENDDVDSVIFNEINSSTSETPSTKLTLADMISKTLTTIPSSSTDKNPNWYVEQQNEIQPRKTNEDKMKTPSPTAIIQSSTLTANKSEDEKLFKYLDYLETKEESPTTKTPKPTPSVSKIPSKPPPQQQEAVPIIDLEQLCRSLTVNDLKDELIRKKIYDLKILIDEQHKKQKSQIPIIKPRKDSLPILIAMPPIAQQRRRTTVIQPTALLQSKTVSLHAPYHTTYHDIISNYNNKQPHPPTNSIRKYQYT